MNKKSLTLAIVYQQFFLQQTHGISLYSSTLHEEGEEDSGFTGLQETERVNDIRVFSIRDPWRCYVCCDTWIV